MVIVDFFLLLFGTQVNSALGQINVTKLCQNYHFEIGNLLEHVSTMSNKYECEQCGKRCKNEKQLDLHILQHKSVELISCTEPECSEEIVQKYLKEHLKNVHNVEIDQATSSWVQGNVKEFQCEDCGRQCKDQKHYDNHKYYHKNTLNGPQITCDKCDLQIPEKLFARHIKRVHENQDEDEEYQESFANDVKVEVTLEEQDEHITEAELNSFEADYDNFQCDECGKHCKDQKHLDNHKQVSSVMEFLLQWVLINKILYQKYISKDCQEVAKSK